MGSGYFPYGVNDKEAEKLIQARMLIREFSEKIAECIYEFSDGQYDNACSDGGYLERLNVAIEMLDGCFKKKLLTKDYAILINRKARSLSGLLGLANLQLKGKS